MRCRACFEVITEYQAYSSLNDIALDYGKTFDEIIIEIAKIDTNINLNEEFHFLCALCSEKTLSSYEFILQLRSVNERIQELSNNDQLSIDIEEFKPDIRSFDLQAEKFHESNKVCSSMEQLTNTLQKDEHEESFSENETPQTKRKLKRHFCNTEKETVANTVRHCRNRDNFDEDNNKDNVSSDEENSTIAKSKVAQPSKKLKYLRGRGCPRKYNSTEVQIDLNNQQSCLEVLTNDSKNKVTEATNTAHLDEDELLKNNCANMQNEVEENEVASEQKVDECNDELNNKNFNEKYQNYGANAIEQACSHILAGINLIIEEKLDPIKNSVSGVKKELQEHKQEIFKKMKYLGNPSLNKEQKFKKALDSTAATTNVRSSYFKASIPSTELRFPLQTPVDLKAFENKLRSDRDAMSKYCSIFIKQLKSMRSATTAYNRRKHLKEMLFTEPLIKQCCWHTPTEGKKEIRFCVFREIIYLFIKVVNSDLCVDSSYDDKEIKLYFCRLFKRRYDPKPTASKDNTELSDVENSSEIESEIEIFKDRLSDFKAPIPSAGLRFPLQTPVDLKAFEDKLRLDSDAMSKYCRIFTKQLKSIRLATTAYNRRKHLKEMLFTEPLIKKCCWHTPTEGKKEIRFSEFREIISLFIKVVNSGLSADNSYDDRAIKLYFSRLLKRSPDLKPTVSKGKKHLKLKALEENSTDMSDAENSSENESEIFPENVNNTETNVTDPKK